MEEKNILIYVSPKEINNICIETVKSMEHWGRRLIHEKLTEAYGNDYLNYVDNDGNRIIKSEIVRGIKKRMEDNPDRYQRIIDATTLENIIDIICNEALYNKHFKEVFSQYYKCGKDEIRNHLSVVRDLRNKIHHGNVISYREAERTICYSHDFIDCLGVYYNQMGKSRDYHAPTILGLTDSLGHAIVYSLDLTKDEKEINFDNKLRSGDVYRIGVEVDPLFSQTSYELEWFVYWDVSNPSGFIKSSNKPYLDISITDTMVGRELRIACWLKSKKTWHRYGDYDDALSIGFGHILPPIEESY